MSTKRRSYQIGLSLECPPNVVHIVLPELKQSINQSISRSYQSGLSFECPLNVVHIRVDSSSNTGTPVALVKADVRWRLSTGPKIFSRTAVSVGQVDTLWLW